MKRLACILATAFAVVGFASADDHEGQEKNKKPGFSDVPPPPVEMLEAYVKEGKPIFSEDLSNAHYNEGGWNWEDGVLTYGGKGDIYTKEKYGDFVAAVEFKTRPGTNSGVFVRTNSIQDWLHTSIELQVLQPGNRQHVSKHVSGAAYDLMPPLKAMVKEPGEWNRYVIYANDNHLVVYLNGELVQNLDLAKWDTANQNPDGQKNKFKYPIGSLERRGHLGLQDHGDPVWYRNLKIREL